MIGDDDFDLEDVTLGDPLRAYSVRDPGAFEAAKKAERKTKREPRPPFATIPLEMAKTLGNPLAMALALCVHLDYKSVGEPFDSPLELFEEYGVSKQQKSRALAELKRRGVITTVEQRYGNARGSRLTFTERWRPMLMYKRKYRPLRRSRIRDQ
jgi:hypothetical protein